jgi:hypothetical protein
LESEVANAVSVGLPYESNAYSNNFEIPMQEGTSQAKKKRMHNVSVRFDSTVEAQVGPNPEHLVDLPFRAPAAPMDECPPLFTGDKGPIEAEADWSRRSQVYVRQKHPLPMTIVAFMPWFDQANR